MALHTHIITCGMNNRPIGGAVLRHLTLLTQSISHAYWGVIWTHIKSSPNIVVNNLK
jgi:hypothetical protein